MGGWVLALLNPTPPLTKVMCDNKWMISFVCVIDLNFIFAIPFH